MKQKTFLRLSRAKLEKVFCSFFEKMDYFLPYPKGLPMLHSFPEYTKSEIAADKLVHSLGIAASLTALAWLLARLATVNSTRDIAAVAVYGAGLLGMLTASALYNFAPVGRLKAAFRQLDHAMIFVMIAGSYTPFLLVSLPPGLGTWLCGLVWCLAAAGVALRLLVRRRPEWVFLALYLGMGWLVLGFLPKLAAVLSTGALACLVAGGVGIGYPGCDFTMWPGTRWSL